ncbi:MAG TPA: phage major capsid protein [Streptosporangiaceae bacterium]
MPYGNIAPDSVKTLKERLHRTSNRMRAIVDVSDGRSMTPAERDEMETLSRNHRDLAHTIRVRKDAQRGAKAGSWKGDSRTEGKPNELLGADQSIATWAKRAKANGNIRNDGTDRDLNRYWQERFGLASPSAETRALEESVTSGSGAGAAIVPIEYSTHFVDLLRAKLIVHNAGCSMLPMISEQHSMPVYTNDVAPTWLAEAGTNSIDANPAFSPLLFQAIGAWQDITLVSRQVVEDTNQEGGLVGLLTETIGAKFARVVDQVAFYGTSGNAGAPGLVNESGLQTSGTAAPAGFGTNGGSPTNYSQISIAAEAIRAENTDPTAIVASPHAVGTYARLVDTLGQPMRKTPDIADIPWLDSTTLLTNETQGTGTSLTSVYLGDWKRLILGMRVELQVTVLSERYADLGCYGIWSYLRFSPRVSHP